VDVVRWEGRVLLALVDWLVVEVVCEVQLLQDRIHLFYRADVLVRLHARQAHRVQPLYWLPSMRHYLCALGEPVLDFVGVRKQITDTLNRHFGKVSRRLVELAISFEDFLLF
jgi:hypothetical protein